jgi:hypothetical protein
MCAAADLNVPLVVDVGVGENWDEAHWFVVSYGWFCCEPVNYMTCGVLILGRDKTN